MATTDRVTIELYVDDQGTVKIRSAKKELEELGRAGEKGFAGAAGAADNFAGAMTRQLGIYSLAIGSAYKLADALGGAFKAGIKAIDDFQQQTIGIAVGLTNMAQAGQGSFKDMFKQNLAFSKTMYEEMRKEDAKRFASLEDLMAGYNAMVQKGYAVRLNEVNALGVLVDRIKLATVSQNTSMQINQEIRSLMDGQARAGSLLAVELQSRVGPGWADIVEKHREAGTLLEYLAGMWPGIGAAAEEIENTLEAQTTTLSGNLKYVGREGLGGAYEDIVGLTKNINEYLRQHSNIIAGDIAKGWETVRNTALDVKNILQWIANLKAITIPVKLAISGLEQLNQLIGPAHYAKMYKSAADLITGKNEGTPLIGYGSEGEGSVGNHAAIGQTVAKKMAAAAGGGGGGGKRGGGGGGAQGSIDRMATIIDGLERELARISEGGLAEIKAWEQQQVNSIEKVARKGAEGAEALAMVERVKQSKIRKLNEDFEKWHAGSVKDQYKSLEMEQANYLKKYRGNKEQEARITQVFGLKKKELEIQSANEVLGIYQDQYQKMAGLAHIGLPAQVRWEKAIIELEEERVDNNLRLLRLQGRISAEQEDQLRDMQKIVSLGRRTEQELRGQGFVGGLKAGSMRRSRERQESGYEMGLGFYDSMQQYSVEIGQTIVRGMFQGGEFNIQEFGLQAAERFVGGLVDAGINELFNSLAEGFVSIISSVVGGMLGGGGGGPLEFISSLFFHSGGMVAHSGLIVAHDGLNLRGDERLAKLQVGEWVLQRQATKRLAAQGVSFQQLNRGQAPGGGRAVTIPLTINVPGAGGKMQSYRETIRVTDQALKKREINLKKGRR